MIDRVRSTGRPAYLSIDTYRFSPHSKGDDTQDPAEIDARRERDPLTVAGSALSPTDRDAIEAAVRDRLAAALETAERAPAAGRQRLWPDRCAARTHSTRPCTRSSSSVTTSFSSARTSSTLRGAFRITRGLSERWPDRVLTTPISEESLFGVAAGMAMRGRRPILEIMFGDFIALGFDQIVNGISKFPFMYDGKVTVPLVVRTPMGGRRGYGPTHSQSLEKLLVGVPGIVVVATSECHDLGALLSQAVLDDRPVFLIENKLMYGRPNRRPEVLRRRVPLHRVRGPLSGADVLRQRARRRRGHDRHLWRHAPACAGCGSRADPRARGFLRDRGPVPAPTRRPRARARVGHRIGAVVTAEEGTRTGGIGAEVAAQVQELAWRELRRPVLRVAAADVPIPAAPGLEEEALPQAQDIVDAVLALDAMPSRPV